MITSFFKPKNPREKDEAAATTPRPKRLREEEASSSISKENKRTATIQTEIEELLSHLNESESECCWKKELDRHFRSSSFLNLAVFVHRERQSNTIYPPAEQTFSALNVCPLDKVKVVIVGQDPYHGPGQAHGLCFSVLKGQQVPPSLKNIYKELNNDPNVEFSIPRHGHLIRWAKQGVLMLNTVLTVRRGQANSHQKKGWEHTTDEILRALDRHCKARGKGVVFLLWGKPAMTKAETVIRSPLHTVIATSHPSPLGATKTSAPFIGSRCFSRCNEALKEKGYDDVIDWMVDGPL
jgi:uracil-DNA glycosylase